MGKSVPRGIKVKANELIELFPDRVGKDFEANKRFIDSLNLPFGKHTRNLIAGYIVRCKNTAASP